MKLGATTLALLVGAVLGGLATWKLKPAPPLPDVLPDTVYVTRPELQQTAPTPTLSGTKRLTHHDAPPELVIIGTVPVRPESTAVAPAPGSFGIRRALPRSQNPGENLEPPALPYIAGRYGHGVLELWTERADSSLLYQRHRVHPPFDFVRDETSIGIVVHEERAWVRFAKDAGRCAAAAAGGALVGGMVVGKDRLAGAAVGAAAGCTATIVF